MSKLKLGELCAGYGGLGLAVEEALGAELAWYSEFDAAPSKIMATHWPDVPNLGDMTLIDWSAVEPVDIISGGTPCQDLSAAGRRKGMTEGTRSNLWVNMREAIASIKPKYVAWENVRGAYSAKADSDLEFCPGCMGASGGAGECVLRALGRVLGDLSDLGYDTQWRGLRAADVGAPHGRFRVFVLATRRAGVLDAGHGAGRPEFGEQFKDDDGPGESGSGSLVADAVRGGSGGRGVVAGAGEGRGPNAEAVGSDDRHGGSGTIEAGAGSPVANTAGVGGHEALKRDGCDAATQNGSGVPHESDRDAVWTRPIGKTSQDADRATGGERRESAPGQAEGGGARADASGRSGAPTTDTNSVRDDRRGSEATPDDQSRPWDGAQPDDLAASVGSASESGKRIGRVDTDWGDYAPAIRRWEAVRGTAPAPTELTAKGKHRLSARFAEWMMGIPAGWVTDVDISRNEQLKAIGNGVVPQQALAAFRDMLAEPMEEKAAA